MTFIESILNTFNELNDYRNFYVLFPQNKIKLQIQEIKPDKFLQLAEISIYKTNFYENQNKREEGGFNKSRKEGKWLGWYPNGVKATETNYHRGFKNGLYKSWYSNGSPLMERNYTNGKLNGPYIDWHHNGLIKEEGLYRNSIKVGNIRGQTITGVNWEINYGF